MSGLVVSGLTKRFDRPRGDAGREAAVDDLSFAVAPGTLFTLLGPSGCGKTTTLRCIAGLERPDAGRVALDGRVLFSSTDRIDVPVSERVLGMVFQSSAIWPHMNAYDNVAFPLTAAPRRRRLPRREIAGRVERALAVVRLEGLAGRRATDLSGGEQQRLALARALVLEPPLLLLDEPLSNLDARLRDEMRFELKRLQGEVGVTTVFVTHDQAEALALSDTVAVMRDGRADQIGAPAEVYERPSSRFVADFIGAANLLRGAVVARRNGSVAVDTEAGTLFAAPAPAPAGGRVLVVVRPENVEIAAAEGKGADGDSWRGVVAGRAFLGDRVDYVVRVGHVDLRVRTDARTPLAQGAAVSLRVPPEACSLVAAEP
jgi:iron(III) transport system ATP-binding protein